MKQFAVIGSGTIISLILGFFNVPIITRMVDPQNFGQFSLFQTYANLILSVLYLGLDQAFVRFYYDGDSNKYRGSLLSACLKIPFIISLGLLIIGFILKITDLIPLELDNSSLAFLILFIIVMLIKRFSDLVVRLQFNSKLYSFINISQKILYLGLAIPLVFFIQEKDSYGLIIALILSNMIVMIMGVIGEKDIWKFTGFQKNIINKKKLLTYSLPFVLSMAITSLFEANNKLFLSNFGTLEELGVFSSATSLMALVNVVQTTFNTIWAPASIEQYTKDPDNKDFHLKGNQLITVTMFGIGLTVILFKDIFSIILGEHYREAAYIIPGLLLGPIMYTISETTVGGIVFKKKSAMNIIVAVGALIVSVIGNFLLVPLLGGRGAALATGFAYIIFFSLRTFIANRYYYIDFKLKKFYLLTFFVFCYVIYNTFNSFGVITVLGYIICMILMIFLYNSTVKEIMDYIINFIKQLVKK